LRSRPEWLDVRLHHGPVVLRTIRRSDRKAWQRVRDRNASWLAPWEATRPPGSELPPLSFRSMVGDLRRQARQGRCLPFVVEVGGELAGQVTVNNVVGGSARFASVGYWIDRRHAGHGHIPVAVSLATDYCWSVLDLHRMEIAIRPENTASLRVVEKLGFTEVGYAPRFLHIDGAWRDHRIFALTVEDVPGGLLRRLVQT
jgi:ribosomal-protein-alanine N-acetyltransferase